MQYMAQKATDISVRGILSRIIQARKPVVMHNGLLDIVFIYHCLYANLPKDITAFTADLAEMFPAGVFDTKYIAEFHSRESASFLEYLFRKAHRANVSDKNKSKGKYVLLLIRLQH